MSPQRSTIRPLAISTLSPIHVGCGEVYEPSSFVIHEGLLHTLDPTDLVAALTDSERQRLAALAGQREPIGAMQRFFRDAAARLAGLARHQVAIVPALEQEYRDKAGRPTQRGRDGEATYNLFPIARTAFRPLDNSPYLPATSLKGSIRTACLNRINGGRDASAAEKAGKPPNARGMEQRLLGYRRNQFQNDPFRLLALADAHPEDDCTPPPTRVLYAISKKKREPRAGERSPPELQVFLETIPDALPAAFCGEVRFGPGSTILWNDLCDACNDFYRPQLEAELGHPVLGRQLDSGWLKLMRQLLDEELAGLIEARQGFLLRVGRHSGAESVTLDGMRSIKILGPRISGKQTSDFRPLPTEKRYARPGGAADRELLPFGWLWIDGSDDRHRHLADALRQKLAQRSRPLCEAHRDRLSRLEAMLAERARAEAAASERRHADDAAARAAAEARQRRERELAAMGPNCRRVQQFRDDFAARAGQLRGNKENPNGRFHGEARALARDAAEWPSDERLAAADAIEEWLPKVVRIDLREERKKLRLAALRNG
ncbi:RAMP superfamily CRISPR-associated protein [Accumulibacter sp.]|uniref:RAMP superfamily CRISPR-associated protein n=1 Tax=Accumulibacter sp. TaxID=2053492 RepID=UPI0025F52E73|nr:RAMP superfamily CRISPR-associated protein [Accumulibacter sp.]MCM8611170.1 RAMP superfamily CRISPR-associated protein [Accumulibacter sp.]MCM8636284.1 RAMP superfamily CRISPR-associated protein [Accumulibacter sp.]MCM8638495.1 RAMP superfamily CRISPR-associated protein [Accumulibacter sp.]